MPHAVVIETCVPDAVCDTDDCDVPHIVVVDEVDMLVDEVEVLRIAGGTVVVEVVVGWVWIVVVDVDMLVVVVVVGIIVGCSMVVVDVEVLVDVVDDVVVVVGESDVVV